MYDADGRISYEKDYRGTIEIHQCSNKTGTVSQNVIPEDLDVMLSVKLLDAYPKSISGISLGHGLFNQISKVTTSITYRDALYEYWDDKNADRNTNNDDRIAVYPSDATEIGNPFNSLKLPKLGTLIKNNKSFLPIRNAFDDLEKHF